MFSEIIGLANFARQVIIDRNTKISGWRKIYTLYCRLDEVIEKSVTAAEHYLPHSLDAPFLQNSSLGPPVVKWVRFTNEDFKKLDSAVKKFLHAFKDVRDVLEIYDENLRHRLEFHFWMKSQWFYTFEEMYASGEIDADGKSINRTALSIADKITDSDSRFLGRSEMKDFIVRETVDISTDDKRQRIIDIGRANIEELKKIKGELAQFIKENCEIQDLL